MRRGTHFEQRLVADSNFAGVLEEEMACDLIPTFGEAAVELHETNPHAVDDLQSHQQYQTESNHTAQTTVRITLIVHVHREYKKIDLVVII